MPLVEKSLSTFVNYKYNAWINRRAYTAQADQSDNFIDVINLSNIVLKNCKNYILLTEAYN